MNGQHDASRTQDSTMPSTHGRGCAAVFKSSLQQSGPARATASRRVHGHAHKKTLLNASGERQYDHNQLCDELTMSLPVLCGVSAAPRRLRSSKCNWRCNGTTGTG